ncbi:hypothetical protein TNCV_2898551 [Trichonephila clavipes]|nr:hypothetical protein TNCV_2898551 [Trichonephila clavipes]
MELEEDSSEIDTKWFHNVPHLLVIGIKNVMKLGRSFKHPVASIPRNNPHVPVMEKDSSKIDTKGFHIVPQVEETGITVNVMNETRMQLHHSLASISRIRTLPIIDKRDFRHSIGIIHMCRKLEENSSEIDTKRFHIVPHVVITGISENHLSLGNVAEQGCEETETNSSFQSLEKFNTYETIATKRLSDGKGKVNLTDQDEDSIKKMSIMCHMRR